MRLRVPHVQEDLGSGGQTCAWEVSERPPSWGVRNPPLQLAPQRVNPHLHKGGRGLLLDEPRRLLAGSPVTGPAWRVPVGARLAILGTAGVATVRDTAHRYDILTAIGAGADVEVVGPSSVVRVNGCGVALPIHAVHNVVLAVGWSRPPRDNARRIERVALLIGVAVVRMTGAVVHHVAATVEGALANFSRGTVALIGTRLVTFAFDAGFAAAALDPAPTAVVLILLPQNTDTAALRVPVTGITDALTLATLATRTALKAALTAVGDVRRKISAIRAVDAQAVVGRGGLANAHPVVTVEHPDSGWAVVVAAPAGENVILLVKADATARVQVGHTGPTRAAVRKGVVIDTWVGPNVTCGT